MKSIWSQNYVTYQNSIQIREFFVKKDLNEISRPKTLGLEKTISTLIDTNKRKFEQLNSQGSSSCSSSAESDFLAEINENDENRTNNKRLKSESFRSDIDKLISDYSDPPSLTILSDSSIANEVKELI